MITRIPAVLIPHDLLTGLHDLRLGSIGLVDLLIALIVVGSLIGALKRRAGILGALGSALGSLVFCWLVVAALVAWAPDGVQQVVSASAFAQNVPLPTHALSQAAQWVQAAIGPGGLAG